MARTWRVISLPSNAANAPAKAWKLARSTGTEELTVETENGACTAALALAQRDARLADAAGENLRDGTNRELSLDDTDWWFQTEFAHEGESSHAQLVFDGLASVVDVWLNGVWLGRTNNMFMRWEADVSSLLAEHNELVLCARAMTPQLQPRRPRARWRTRLLGSQEWRWHRTTQMGRMPGFGPATPPVGPWRAVYIERRVGLTVRALSVHASARDGSAHLSVDALLDSHEAIQRATLSCGDVSLTMRIDRDKSGKCRLRSDFTSTELALWWPHTHGTPHTHKARIAIELADGETVDIDLGNIGFRSVSIDTQNNDFGVSINEHALFLRGVCWNSRDWTRVDVPLDELDQEFSLLVEAGINCIRLPGCFTYASREFLNACDRYGVMVWQDLMFSVLDYPDADAQFVALCEREARQVLSSLQSHACIAVVCGSSEVAQQSAMMGVPPLEVSHSLFRERLAVVAGESLPGVPYWTSTPWGGALPFDVQSGTSHYFGVGAYLRELSDARRSQVKFATECLAFAHVPEPASLEQSCSSVAHVHGSQWKRRIPRDGGASWDFEDVRDHYVERFFGVSAALLRETEPNRYLAMSRAASAIAVERTMQEFRRSESTCNGALMWLWSDPWMSAGWGCTDYLGRPKSAWFAMRRTSRPVAIALSNEGMNGAALHVWNDSPHAVSGTLMLRLLSEDGNEYAVASEPLSVGPRASRTLSCDAVFDRFTDIVHAYRFGQPTHDAVHAAWLCSSAANGDALVTQLAGREIIDEAVLLPLGDARTPRDTGLRVDDVVRVNENTAYVTLSSLRTTTHVRIGSACWTPDDSYFTLVPDVRKVVCLRRTHGSANDAASMKLSIDALDTTHAISIAVPSINTWLSTASVLPALVHS